MQISFCGGAGEVGASCYLLNIDNKNILLDCGIRMNPGKDALPDFRIIQEQGGVDAIFISHAHLDHTGSLPIISREYPHAPIYMTHASKDLLRVLLYDSLKIMEQSEGEIPIYAEPHVEQMLGRIVCYSPEFPITPFKDGSLKVTFYHAGHIVGGSAIYVQGEEGSLFYSGDFSVAKQHTVGGAVFPRLRPDVAIMESTYGDKLHANREVEEDRLVETVKGVLERGGKILIPAFALGRAQEIILILKRAMNRKKLSRFKIFVDGMVREICRVYRLNPNYLRPSLAKKVWRDKEIFFDESIQPVSGRDMRDEIVSMDEPCCIISSSGMLTGGPSQFYAEKLACDERNLIAITGYQDEEAPGRHLLNLMEDGNEERVLPLGDRKIPIKCEIGKYNLSAHADRGEIISLTHTISPKQVFLVHGERESMGNLGSHMQSEIRGRVFLAANGETHQLRLGRIRKQLERIAVLSMGRKAPMQEEDMESLWRHILDHNGQNFTFSPEELHRIWNGKQSEEEETKRIYGLANESLYFEPDTRRPFLFRPVSPEKVFEELDEEGPMEVNQMLALVDVYFPPETGLYKKGARFDEKQVLLYFKFPKVAGQKYSNKFLAFEEETGWTVVLNQECNLEAAEDVLLEVLPPGVFPEGSLSYYREQGLFKVSLKGEADWSEIKRAFCQKTGLDLIVDNDVNDSPVKPVAAQEGQMEQNQAFQRIDEAFADTQVRLYKKSLKRDKDGPYIELSFISPEVGKRYLDLMEELEEKIRWKLKINPNPNQNEIIKTVRRLIENRGLYLKKNPGFFSLEKSVKVIPMGEWEESTFLDVKDEVKSLTGYELILG